MKKIIPIVFILSLLLLTAIHVWGAGTVTQTYAKTGSGITELTFSFTADPNGTVSDTNTEAAMDGYLLQMVTNPGSTAPTDNYDITIKNSDGVDLLNGNGADRDTSNSEIAFPDPNWAAVTPPFFSGLLTLGISNNSQASATGEVILYIKRP